MSFSHSKFDFNLGANSHTVVTDNVIIAPPLPGSSL